MAKLVINENKTEGHINPEIYGHLGTVRTFLM